jgi:hypothetical protein
MRLKQRIKQIESKIKINSSEFCACENSPRVEVGYENKGVQTIENPIPVFCERCRKPVEKRRIIVCFVESRE